MDKINKAINWDAKIQMKRNKITEQIGSFKNKEEKGLFTFYLQTQLPHQVLTKVQTSENNTPSIDRQSNLLIDSKRVTPRKSVHQRKKPIKTLTQQLNEGDSIGLLTRKNKYKRILTQGSTQQINKIKELFNFKRKSNQKLIEECIRNNKKMQSSKSIRVQRKISKFKRSQNYSQIPSIGSHLVYPLEEIKQKQYFPTKSPKKRQSLQKDYHEYQTLLLPQLQTQSKMNLQNTIHQLKCQVIIHPEKFKSIIYPSGKKHRNPYIKDHHLLISSDVGKEDKIPIELKMKFETPSELRRLINGRGNDENMNEKISKVTDYQDTPYGLLRFTPNKKHHLFNTLERSLMSSLDKVDQQEYQNDLKELFKDSSSNLLNKRSQNYSQNAKVSEFRVKLSVAALQKPQRLHHIRKNESQMMSIKDSRLKYGNILDKSIRKDQSKDKSVKEMKRNFLQILTKIKDRYQSI